MADVEGIEEFAGFLERAPRQAVPGALRAGLRAGAAVIAQAVELRLPRAIRASGDADAPPLADDLDTEVAVDANGGIARVGFYGAAADRAIEVEYGHRMVGHDPNRKQLGQVPAYPFMRPAADASEAAAVEAVEAAFCEKLKEEGIIDGG